MEYLFTANKDYTNGHEIKCDLHGFYDGGTVTVFVDGKPTERKVRDCKDGLYINMLGTHLFYEDFN